MSHCYSRELLLVIHCLKGKAREAKWHEFEKDG